LIVAFDAFLKIAAIPGESTDEKHKDWIEVLSYGWGVFQPASGSSSTAGGRSAERADFEKFIITKALDKASPKLALSCANGEHINEVTLELCRAVGDKQLYMKYKMSDVIVGSVHPCGSSKGAENLPLEDVSFHYGKIEMTYTETDHATGKPKGNVAAYWDVKANKGG
jgi:type VI secretion system secreted protein Hcp